MIYDMAVIGGGPGGYVAAIKGAKLGLKVLLIEKEKLGGVCLNRGCIPTKTLLKCSGMLESIKNAGIYGIYTGEIRADFSKMMERKEQVVKTLVKGVEGLVKANGIDYISGEGHIIDKRTVRAGGLDYAARNIVIATGSLSVVPKIEGIKDSSVMDSDGILSMKSLPSSIAIVGGGVIGVEFGVLLNELGSDVVIIEMLEDILYTMDQDIIQKTSRMLEKKNIQVITGARVKKIDSGKILFEKNGESRTVESERVLIAVGRIPNTDTAELDRLGIRHNGGRIETDERMQTNISGIYAIGDVNGKYMLAHVASAEGIVAAENISGRYSRMDYKAIPQCVYLHPEIACTGMTEKEARKKGHQIKTGIFPLHANGKSVAEGETDGIVKIICDEKSGEVLGMHMISPHATDMISEAVLAIGLEATAKEVACTVHPHPTAAEAVMEAASAVAGGAIHMTGN